jgi:Mrp family chromosome partitioning ATPase
MRNLLAAMKPRYNVIIVDSSPLGAGVDPFVLGTLTGNIVMVMRTGATDRELAGVKLDALQRLPIRILGAVLNAVPARGSYKYYSYISSYQLPPVNETEPAGTAK